MVTQALKHYDFLDEAEDPRLSQSKMLDKCWSLLDRLGYKRNRDAQERDPNQGWGSLRGRPRPDGKNGESHGRKPFQRNSRPTDGNQRRSGKPRRPKGDGKGKDKQRRNPSYANAAQAEDEEDVYCDEEVYEAEGDGGYLAASADEDEYYEEEETPEDESELVEDVAEEDDQIKHDGNACASKDGTSGWSSIPKNKAKPKNDTRRQAANLNASSNSSGGCSPSTLTSEQKQECKTRQLCMEAGLGYWKPRPWLLFL